MVLSKGMPKITCKDDSQPRVVCMHTHTDTHLSVKIFACLSALTSMQAERECPHSKAPEMFSSLHSHLGAGKGASNGHQPQTLSSGSSQAGETPVRTSGTVKRHERDRDKAGAAPKKPAEMKQLEHREGEHSSSGLSLFMTILLTF